MHKAFPPKYSRNAAIESETMSSPVFDLENKMSGRIMRKISNIMDDNMTDVPRKGVKHKDKVRSI